MTPDCRHEPKWCCRHCCLICREQHRLGVVRDPAPVTLPPIGDIKVIE